MLDWWRFSSIIWSRLGKVGGGFGGLGGALGDGFGFALSIVGTAIASCFSNGQETIKI